MAKPLEIVVARASVMPTQQNGRTKSSKQIAAKELRPLDTVLIFRKGKAKLVFKNYFATCYKQSFYCTSRHR